MKVKPTLEERFWAKVAVAEPEECWEWQGGKARGNYGSFAIRHGVIRPAHRVSWLLTNGDIPDGLWVLHKCDNPPCVNPAHLFLGTRQDNMDDMKAKRRHPAHWGAFGLKGEANGRAKITTADIRVIRTRRARGETLMAIAADYPITCTMVGQIIRGESWRHVS